MADTEVTGPELFTGMRAFQAQLVVLQDAGHIPRGNVEFGDDADSRQFVAEVRRLNRTWRLGQTARPPRPVRRSVIHLPAREPAARPRERRPVRRARARSPGRQPDDPSEPELVAVPLERFKRDVDRWLGAA
jgi:hypothetical protein